jgi:hypothetical protein
MMKLNKKLRMSVMMSATLALFAGVATTRRPLLIHRGTTWASVMEAGKQNKTMKQANTQTRLVLLETTDQSTHRIIVQVTRTAIGYSGVKNTLTGTEQRTRSELTSRLSNKLAASISKGMGIEWLSTNKQTTEHNNR